MNAPSADCFARARQLFLDGLAALGSDRLGEAERCFVASLDLLPGRASTVINLAAVRLRMSRPVDALAALEPLLRAEPAHADAWFHHGDALAAMGRHREALASFDKVLALGVTGPSAAQPWFRHGQMLQALEQPARALQSYDRALAEDPGLAQAWTNRGNILREMQRPDDAAEAFRRAIAHGADPELHGYYLASVVRDEVPPPAIAPSHYVESLFDDYADQFDAHLVGRLGYRAHLTLAEQLAALGRGPFGRAIDLGCGTGLCGPLIRPMARELVGVDLSQRMLEKAEALGVYDRLVRADIVDFLNESAPGSIDLVVAADVFIYVGDLGPSFAAAERAIAPGGLLCFSAECTPAESRDFELQPSLRYAHTERYLRSLAARHSFDVVRLLRAPIRDDQREAVSGIFACLVRHDAG